jgi:ATP-binding cassette ChvD family protein
VRTFAKKKKGKGGSKGGGGGGKKKQGQTSKKSAGGGVPGEFLFTMSGVSKTLPGGRVLFKDVHLSFLKGAKIGVLGLNGSGKSSLLKGIAGIDDELEGEVWVRDGIKVLMLAQEPVLDYTLDVQGNVALGLSEQKALLQKHDELSAEFGEPDADFDKLIAEQEEVQSQIDAVGAWDLDRKVGEAMRALRVPDGNSDPSVLSGGEKRRVALARTLLEAPDVLLLDEPTNHLDAETVSWMETFLSQYKGTVVCVTHDRYFLDNVAGWILELDGGRALPFEGNYSGWLEQKQSRLNLESKQEARRAQVMQRELEFVRAGSTKGGSGAKARQNKYQSLLTEGSEMERHMESGAIIIPPPPRLGEGINVKDLRVEIGDRTLIEKLSFRVNKGDIIGVVGPNGVGKSTLFSVLTSQLEPVAGKVAVGQTVSLGHVSQNREGLKEDSTVYDCISQGKNKIQVGDFSINMRAYCSAFNLKGTAQQKLVKNLSGGERNRTFMAMQLAQGHNVLLLDEPTNDLDVETLRSLEEALLEFCEEGAAMIVSHDRWFLDRICTHTLAFEGDGTVVSFPGCWSEYEASKQNEGLPASSE